jgi:hypothetical protein
MHHENETRRMRNHCFITAGIIATGVVASFLPHAPEVGLWTSLAVNLFWVWAD